jgi:predicted transcriptional regulator
VSSKPYQLISPRIITVLLEWNLRKRRGKIDIINRILETANGGGGGITKTNTMMTLIGSLTHAQMKEHLILLTENEGGNKLAI